MSAQGTEEVSTWIRHCCVNPMEHRARGSALSGLLRDGAYRLLKLPPLKKYSAEESTNEILKRLFGSPKQAKRWRISSARPGEKILDDAQSIHRVRIDPRTRRAESGKLFSKKKVCPDIFLFTITCPNSGKAELDNAAILIAAARFVRQFGRSRKRGLGECSIHLIDAIGIDEASLQLIGRSGSWIVSIKCGYKAIQQKS